MRLDSQCICAVGLRPITWMELITRFEFRISISNRHMWWNGIIDMLFEKSFRISVNIWLLVENRINIFTNECNGTATDHSSQRVQCSCVSRRYWPNTALGMHNAALHSYSNDIWMVHAACYKGIHIRIHSGIARRILHKFKSIYTVRVHSDQSFYIFV